MHSFSARILLLLAGATSLVASVPAQQVLIMARDLLEAPRLTAAATHSNRVLRTPIGAPGEDNLPRCILGEATLLNARHARPLISADDLAQVIEQLGGLQPDKLDYLKELSGFLAPVEDAEKVETALALIRGQAARPLTVSLRLDHITKQGSTTLLRGSQEFRAGETITLADTSRQNKIVSYGVEIAQGAAISNPMPMAITSGASASMRARPILGSEFALIEVVVRVAANLPSSDMIGLADGPGPIQRVATQIDECATAFRIPRDGRTVHSWSDWNGDELRLTCSATWALAPPLARGDVVLHVSPLLQGTILGFQTSFAEEDPDEEQGLNNIATLLKGSLQSENHSLALISGDHDAATGILMLAGPHARTVEAAVLRTLDKVIEPANISLQILDVPAGKGPDADGKLPESCRIIATIKAPVLANHSACFTGGREQTTLHDWENEVAQSSRIPVPDVRMITEGYFLNTLVETNSSGKPSHLSLAAEWLYTEATKPVPVTLDRAILSPDSSTQTKRGPGSGSSKTTTSQLATILPQDKVTLEQPKIRSKQIATRVTLDANGKATLRRTATKLFGPKRELLILITCRG